MLTNVQKAIYILHNTQDGDELSPDDLYLVQCGTNGNLTEAGQEAFDHLYNQVHDETYQTPWFHGVEHMTFNHHGWVMWRDIRIDHYSYVPVAREGGRSFPYSHKAQTKIRAIAHRCKAYEWLRLSINGEIAVWTLFRNPRPEELALRRVNTLIMKEYRKKVLHDRESARNR